MYETMVLSGVDGLWILGRPYILGGRETKGLCLLYKLAIFSSFLSVRHIDTCQEVRSLGNLR